MATLQRPKIVKRLSWQDMSGPRIHLTRRIVQLQGNKVCADILEQARQICNDYIEAKLERDGIKNWGLSFAFVNSTEKPSETTSLVSTRIQEVGELLELSYPRLYKDISSHVNVRFTSENAVHEVFNDVSSEILSDGLNWARIIALYTFAGALVSECCRDGRNRYVLDIGSWMYEFAALYLVDWIKGKGGWDDLLRAFPYGIRTTSRYPLVLEVSRQWTSYLCAIVKTCFGTAFDFLSFSYKAYLRGMRNVSRKIST